MRLEQFKIGDLVHVPEGYRGDSDRYSTVKYIGEKYVFLRSQFGEEFITPRKEEGFALYLDGNVNLEDQIIRLTVLGRDLIAAIELSIPHHTPSLTSHMREAIFKFREEIRRV